MDDDIASGELRAPCVSAAPSSSAIVEGESLATNAVLHCQRILREYGWCKLEPPAQMAIVDIGIQCFAPSRQEKLERVFKNLGFPDDCYRFEIICTHGEPLLNGESSEDRHVLCKLIGKAAIDKLDSILVSSPCTKQGEWRTPRDVRDISTPRNPNPAAEVILSDGQAIMEIEHYYYLCQLKKMQQETPGLLESLRTYLDERAEKHDTLIPHTLVMALASCDLAPEGVVNQNFLRMASLSLQRNKETQKTEVHSSIDSSKTEFHQRLMSLFGKDCVTPDR